MKKIILIMEQKIFDQIWSVCPNMGIWFLLYNSAIFFQSEYNSYTNPESLRPLAVLLSFFFEKVLDTLLLIVINASLLMSTDVVIRRSCL